MDAAAAPSTRSDIEDVRPFGFGPKGVWRPTHCNEVLRFTRYRNGDFFSAHKDGAFVKDKSNRSIYTLMLYLNDAEFGGGETTFYAYAGDTKPSEHGLVDEESLKQAPSMSIKPRKGMAVLFNHDVWHKGNEVRTQHAAQHKYILRTDLMFKNYDAETFDEADLLADPLYQQCMAFHHAAVEFAEQGKTQESTVAYLNGLAIQTLVPSVIRDTNGAYYGAELLWFDVNVYEHTLSFLDVYQLASASKVSRAWHYYASSPNLWKKAYAKYFGIAQVHSDDANELDTAYNTLFRCCLRLHMMFGCVLIRARVVGRGSTFFRTAFRSRISFPWWRYISGSTASRSAPRLSRTHIRSIFRGRCGREPFGVTATRATKATCTEMPSCRAPRNMAEKRNGCSTKRASSMARSFTSCSSNSCLCPMWLSRCRRQWATTSCSCSTSST